MTTWFYVSPPVSTLQLDLETEGEIVLVGPVAAIKDVITNRVGSVLHVIVFRMNTNEFSGLFATVNAPVTGIRNVAGARGDATDAAATVRSLSQIDPADIVLNVQ
jgi:hypothetical protein